MNRMKENTVDDCLSDASRTGREGAESVPTVRIGMVNYINTSPIYEPWKQKKQPAGWFVHEAPPATLNSMLSRGELDLGFVSSYEYARNPSQYRILPDLSISANGKVGSVFLFARNNVEDLDGKLLLLSNQSETSAYLMRVVLEEFFGIKPEYITGNIRNDCTSECQGILAIGDDALRIAEEKGYDLVLDLGEVWKERTGLPFVFAVCAVREQFCLEQPLLLREVHDRLIACRVEGEQNLLAICESAAPRIPMDIGRCHRYLRGIEFNLDDGKIAALERYFMYLEQRGDIGSTALPLRIHDF